MPREIVTLQVGQCGNQIGFETWKELCREHALDSHGFLTSNSLEGIDNKDIFFHELDNNRFSPRTILVDSEPRVLNSIKNSEYSQLFRADCTIHSKDGSGAGNVWTQGFSQGKLMLNDIFDMIDRELDDCDNLEAFFLNHSIAGGTGSGMGSMIIQELADRYPKKLINSVSVMPNIGQSSDTVVQPYNAILSLSHLSDYADSIIVMDNTALNRIVVEKLRLSEPDFTQTNKFVAKALSGLFSPIRFPRHSFTNYLSILASLVPIHGLHYLYTSYTPLGGATIEDSIDSLSIKSKKFSINDTLKRLLKPQNTLASISLSSLHSDLSMSQDSKAKDNSQKAPVEPSSPLKHKFISLMSILRGNVDYTQINRSMTYLRDQKLVDMVNWTPACFQTCVTYRPIDNKISLSDVEQENMDPKLKYLNCGQSNSKKISNKVDGMLIANHTSISKSLSMHLNSFIRLKKSKAYLKNYINDDFDESALNDLMNKSRETVERQINLYQNSIKDNFLESLV